MTDEKITISLDDLQTRKVETRLKEQDALARNRAYAQMKEDALPVASAENTRPSFWYNPIVVLVAFGLLGGLVAGGASMLLRFEPSAETKARISCTSGWRVRRFLKPIRRISGRATMVAIRYCQNAIPVEAMPKPPYWVGVGNSDCGILLPASARLASTMRSGPTRTALRVVEESWLISILS